MDKRIGGLSSIQRKCFGENLGVGPFIWGNKPALTQEKVDMGVGAC
jgi:hypothetical protein